MRRVDVPGGICILGDVFDPALVFPTAEMAIVDPPYGDSIVDADWDNVTGSSLSAQLRNLMDSLSQCMLPGSHLWMWGGIGTPNNRALYRTLLDVESDGAWAMAEQITWRKKRAYGTNWRCLMTREECLRFVLGDPKKPRFYQVQFTDEERGYAGFNAKYPAKSKFKRLTMVWDHASDMGTKPHKCYKPAPLARSQILATSEEGDLILDLFAGSGEVSIQARDLDRAFIAYENDPSEFEKLLARLRD